MTLKPKLPVDFTNLREKNRRECAGIIDRIIASIEDEIEMIGSQRRRREERHARAYAASMAECDERADFLIRRKDLVCELKAMLDGKIGPIPPVLLLQLPAPEKKPVENKLGVLIFGKKKMA